MNAVLARLRRGLDAILGRTLGAEHLLRVSVPHHPSGPDFVTQQQEASTEAMRLRIKVRNEALKLHLEVGSSDSGWVQPVIWTTCQVHTRSRARLEALVRQLIDVHGLAVSVHRL